MEKLNKCEVTIKKSGLVNRKIRVITKNCSPEQLDKILKKRDIKINDVNLVKKN